MPQSIKPLAIHEKKKCFSRNVCASSAVHAAFVISAVSDENKAIACLIKEAQPLELSKQSHHRNRQNVKYSQGTCH